MMGNRIEAFIRTILGRPRLQQFVERIDALCLRAMNVGGHALVDESGELLVLDRLARASWSNPAVILDVGASVGDWAEAALSRVSRIQLHCFEPSSSAFAALHERLGHRQGVELVNAALGEHEGEVVLYAPEEGSPLSSLYQRRLDHFGMSMDPLERVRVRRLDAYCVERGIERVTLLKLDVEGHELQVLWGAGDLIASRRIDTIQFEFGGCNIDSRTFFQDFFYLLNPHYRIYRILHRGLVEIPAYREEYERFITTNLLAVARSE